MKINEKQGLAYKKRKEGFSSQISAPETTKVNNEDLSVLDGLKQQFESAISDYSALRNVIAQNARNYVTLKDKDTDEYKNFVNRNIKLNDGSKYHITNSGLAKRYSENAWNNRHSSCKTITDDPKHVSIQNESELTSGTPSILLGTPMKSNEPCNYGYQNVEVNLPVHNDPKLVGCYYNSSARDEDRNIIVTDEQALKPDTNEEIIGTDMTYEECRMKSLVKVKDFFSLTNLDGNSKGTCIGSNNTAQGLKYDRFGEAKDDDGNLLCDQTVDGYTIGKPQKCTKVADVCQPRQYEQIDEFYDCDVTDTIGTTSQISGWSAGGSSVLYPHYFLRVTLTAGTQRWDATGAMQKIVVAYDNLADKFSPEIEFTGRIAKGATVAKIVTVPFNPEHTEIFGIAIYFGRDMLGLESVQLEVSRDMQQWESLGSIDVGKIWEGRHATKYDEWMTIRTDKEYSIQQILPQGRVGSGLDFGTPGRLPWSPLDTHWGGDYYLSRSTNKLVTSLKIDGNISEIELFYKFAGYVGSEWVIQYTGNGNSLKTLSVENATGGIIYLDYPIPANYLSIRVKNFNDTGDSYGRPKMNVTVYGTDIDKMHSKVNYEGTYKAVGSKAAAVQTDAGEMTFEQCIQKAAEMNLRYFGVFHYNTNTNKVKCFLPSRTDADDAANDFYMAGYEDSWEQLGEDKSSVKANGMRSGNSRNEMAIFTTNAECFKRNKNGRPLKCPSGSIYYGVVPGVGSTDQCCTQKDDCDSGFSTVYSTEITDASTMGNKGYVDRDNVLHPYSNIDMKETDKSCPKTEVKSITGELWSKFNMGIPMTKERTCGVAKLSPDELSQLDDAETTLRDIAAEIDTAIDTAYDKNVRLKERKEENKKMFENKFNEYKEQYKKVATDYSQKIQTMYEDLELKHSGDYAQMAFLALLTGAIVAGGIYYIRKEKKPTLTTMQ